MASKRNKSRKNRTKKNTTKKNTTMKREKRWTTALTAANKTLTKTGSMTKARLALKSQALTNARRLFGSVGERL